MKTTKEMLDEIDSIKSRINTLEMALANKQHEEENNPSFSPKLPEMVKIPNRPYSLGKYPVTVGQWKEFARDVDNGFFYDNPGFFYDNSAGPDNNPITSVTYEEVQKYITWLNAKTSQTYRLPSEDEWEYCCADHKEATKEIAVFDQHCVSPISTKAPNSFGLFDMLGNVWEFTSSFENNPDFLHKRIIIRGGSWYSSSRSCRSAYRGRYRPDARESRLGFRLLREG